MQAMEATVHELLAAGEARLPWVRFGMVSGSAGIVAVPTRVQLAVGLGGERLLGPNQEVCFES